MLFYVFKDAKIKACWNHSLICKSIHGASILCFLISELWARVKLGYFYSLWTQEAWVGQGVRVPRLGLLPLLSFHLPPSPELLHHPGSGWWDFVPVSTEIVTCHGHASTYRINFGAAAAADFNTSWRAQGWRTRMRLSVYDVGEEGKVLSIFKADFMNPVLVSP